MSKPSELVEHIWDGILRVKDWPNDELDGAQRERIEQQLRDADRLIWEAVEALEEADRPDPANACP